MLLVIHVEAGYPLETTEDLSRSYPSAPLLFSMCGLLLVLARPVRRKISSAVSHVALNEGPRTLCEAVSNTN